MIVRIFLLAAAALLAVHAPVEAADGEFEAAKALYASASYEEALTKLTALAADTDQIQVNQYQSLCLLALGRTQEAETPLQRIIASNPLYVVNQAEVSPRLVDLFHELRRKALPTMARDLYTKAKASFDASQDAAAATEFETLLALLKDPDIAGSALNTADMKDLAQGFLTLTKARLAAADQAAAAERAAAVPAAAAPASAAPAQPKVYSQDDQDVRPPVEVQRAMPRWAPVNPLEKQGTFRGTLKIVINERGEVASATLLDSVFPTYNAQLLDLAKLWKYRPATRQGTPVWYTLVLEIVLQPVA